MERRLEDDYPLDDPFRLGYRIQVLEPGGEIEWIPLTADDLLDPQPNFESCQDGPHSSMLVNLYEMLKRHFKGQDALVLPVMKLIWHIPGLPEPAPDIAIIRGIRELEDHDQWYFDVIETGIRPSLIIEIAIMLDPEARQNDYDKKVEIYERAGIPEYLIIAPATHLTDNRLVLTGYRLGGDGRYQQIDPDTEGRLLFRSVDLSFGVAEDERTLQIFEFGRRILTGSELEAALKAEEARAAAVEAELAQLRAELELLKGR